MSSLFANIVVGSRNAGFCVEEKRGKLTEGVLIIKTISFHGAFPRVILSFDLF